jgi:CheY-like chemotaxis protein
VTERSPVIVRRVGSVLLVEDDQDLRETIAALLSRHGHQVHTAADGAEALGWLKRHGTQPCLVLLDLMMPGMNGFDLRSHMTADPDLASIPVVIITGAGVLADQRAHELRAEILKKPVAMSTLLGTVDRYCATS